MLIWKYTCQGIEYDVRITLWEGTRFPSFSTVNLSVEYVHFISLIVSSVSLQKLS